MLRVAIFIFAIIATNVAVAAPFVYSLSYAGGVKVFDAATQTFVPNTIPTPSFAVGFAVSPMGNRVYLSGGSTILVIDSATQSQINSISVPACVSTDGQRISLRPQNDFLYFACDIGGGQFSLFPIAINGNTYTVQPAAFTTNGWPIGMVTNAAGTRMWIARWGLDVLAVDLGIYSTTAVVPAIIDPETLTDIAYSQVQNRVYVPTGNGVVPIDGSTDMPLAAIGSGVAVRSVAVSNSGNRIYALDNTGAINAYDSNTGTSIGSVTGLAAGTRMAIAVDPATDNVIALGNMGSCSGPGGTGGPFQVINANTLVAGAPVLVPGIYCEPRAAGQIIMAFVPVAAPAVAVPALSWYALILLGFGTCLVLWASGHTRRI